MKNRWYRKILAVSIILLFMGVSVSFSFAVHIKQHILNKDKITSVNVLSIQSGNILKRRHLIPLLISYYFIEHESIKIVVKDIIIDLIFSGEVTIEEILELVNNKGLKYDGVYILPKIETTKITDGELSCYPGDFLVNLFGYNARGSYVRYKTWYLALYGWHLKFNGNKVSQKGGHFIGYYGYLSNYYDWFSYPPGDYNTINFNGYSCIAFHGC
jgi:hypothetical protein